MKGMDICKDGYFVFADPEFQEFILLIYRFQILLVFQFRSFANSTIASFGMLRICHSGLPF